MTASVGTASLLLNTLLPGHLLTLGGTRSQIGLLYSVTTIGSMLVRPVVGGWVDRHGAVRVLLPGVVLLGGTALAFHFVRAPFGMIGLMVGIGLSVGLIGTCSDTVVARSTAAEHRGEALALYYLALSVPSAIGPTVGFALAGVWGMRAGFTFVACLAAIIAILAVSLPRHNGERLPQWPQRAGYISLRNPTLLATGILTSLGLGPIYAFVPLYARAHGFSDVSWFFVLLATFLIGCRISFRQLSDRVGRARVLVPAITTVALGFASLALDPTVVSLTSAAVLIGAGFSVFYPTLMALAVDRTPQTEVGLTVGTMFSACDLGIVVGSALSGLIVEHTSYATGFALLALSATAGLTTFVLGERASAGGRRPER